MAKENDNSDGFVRAYEMLRCQIAGFEWFYKNLYMAQGMVYFMTSCVAQACQLLELMKECTLMMLDIQLVRVENA